MSQRLRKKRRYLDVDDWRRPVNPAFIRYYSAYKANRALHKIPDEKDQGEAFQRNFRELSAASWDLHAEEAKLQNSLAAQVWRAIDAPLDGEVWPWPLSGEPGRRYVTNPESSAFFRDLVFLKYGITFREFIMQLDKNPNLYRKLRKVHDDFHKLQTGTPLGALRLKFNLDHFQIIRRGLDLGLDKLNEWELADCFDEICPCAQKHSSEYLKKLRTRMKKACKDLAASKTQVGG